MSEPQASGGDSVSFEPLVPESGAPYAVKLSVFEGPLDLLLHLIRLNEVDVADIPIARIAEQYLEYIELMQELDLDVAAEYLLMAATLAWIKSRMLLPAEPAEGEEEAAPPEEPAGPSADEVAALVAAALATPLYKTEGAVLQWDPAVPLNAAQWEALLKAQVVPDAVVHFDLSDEEAAKRLYTATVAPTKADAEAALRAEKALEAFDAQVAEEEDEEGPLHTAAADEAAKAAAESEGRAVATEASLDVLVVDEDGNLRRALAVAAALRRRGFAADSVTAERVDRHRPAPLARAAPADSEVDRS